MSFKETIGKIIASAISYILPPRLMSNKKFFPIWEKRGYHIVRNHYYEPIPDSRSLKNELWTKQTKMIGVDINEKQQIELLSKFIDEFKVEYEKFSHLPTNVPYEYYLDNSAFRSVDAEILYCMIRHHKPKKIIEIGSGFTTYLSAQAINKNKETHNADCQLIAIEPFPNETLIAGFPGLTKIIKSKAQDIPLSEFEDLGENDILFIDSSHTLSIGGDVQYEYLEILPRLKKNVIAHFHDIFLPAEYPRNFVLEKFLFWTEQYLLQAFLSFNDSFKTLWAGSYMHINHPDILEKAFKSYHRENVLPGSFWIQKIK